MLAFQEQLVGAGHLQLMAAAALRRQLPPVQSLCVQDSS